MKKIPVPKKKTAVRRPSISGEIRKQILNSLTSERTLSFEDRRRIAQQLRGRVKNPVNFVFVIATKMRKKGTINDFEINERRGRYRRVREKIETIDIKELFGRVEEQIRLLGQVRAARARSNLQTVLKQLPANQVKMFLAGLSIYGRITIEGQLLFLANPDIKKSEKSKRIREIIKEAKLI